MKRRLLVLAAPALLLAGCGAPYQWREAEVYREGTDRPVARVENVRETESDFDPDAPPANWDLSTPQCRVIVLARVREVREAPGRDPARPWRITFTVLESLKGRCGEDRLTVYVASPWRSLQEPGGELVGRLVLIGMRVGASGDWLVHEFHGMRLVRSAHELRPWLGGRMWRAYPGP